MHISQGAEIREALPQPTDLVLTSPPKQELFEQLAARQLVETATCGWMQFGDIWEAWGCVSQTTCKTINGKYFGCFETIYTTCLPSTICANAATVADRDLCCERSTFLECITGYKTMGDTELTGYRCAVSTVKGDLSVYENSSVPGASSTTPTLTTDPTIGSTTQPRTTTVISSETGTPTQTDSPSPTPVGPIVGGVIGGVAVIALIGFGIWFILRRKRNQPPAPPVQPQQPPMEYQPQPQYQQTPIYNPAYAAVSQSPPPMSPPPESTHGYQPTPDQAGYGQKYDPSRSPVQAQAVEMPIDNPRDSRAPVELQ